MASKHFSQNISRFKTRSAAPQKAVGNGRGVKCTKCYFGLPRMDSSSLDLMYTGQWMGKQDSLACSPSTGTSLDIVNSIDKCDSITKWNRSDGRS